MAQKSKALAPMPTSNGAELEEVTTVTDFGTLFLKRNRYGQVLQPVRANMTLSEKAGHIYKVHDEYRITADGYKHMNKVANINIVKPPTVAVGDLNVPNPAIERDEYVLRKAYRQNPFTWFRIAWIGAIVTLRHFARKVLAPSQRRRGFGRKMSGSGSVWLSQNSRKES